MSSQKRTIMGACEYSIATLQNLKRDLSDLGAPNPELNWAIGGIVATLVSNLLQICHQTFQEATVNGEPNAKHDLEVIKQRLSAFIDRMVHHE